MLTTISGLDLSLCLLTPKNTVLLTNEGLHDLYACSTSDYTLRNLDFNIFGVNLWVPSVIVKFYRLYGAIVSLK